MISECKIINLPKISNPAGNISPIHSRKDVPFDFARVFYIYDIPSGKSRGGHAHKECHEFLIAVCGSFTIEIDDGRNKKSFHLNKPDYGFHLHPGVWAAEKNFSSNAVCLVLTSHPYDEDDYIRDYESYIQHLENIRGKIS